MGKKKIDYKLAQEMYRKGKKQIEIAKYFKVTQAAIHKVLNGAYEKYCPHCGKLVENHDFVSRNAVKWIIKRERVK